MHAHVEACVVAIGGNNGAARLDIQHRLAASGLMPVVAVHPSAFVAANASLRQDRKRRPWPAICAEARLGEACIVKHSSIRVDHECVLAPAFISGPGLPYAAKSNDVGDFAFVLGAGNGFFPVFVLAAVQSLAPALSSREK